MGEAEMQIIVEMLSNSDTCNLHSYDLCFPLSPQHPPPGFMAAINMSYNGFNESRDRVRAPGPCLRC